MTDFALKEAASFERAREQLRIRPLRATSAGRSFEGIVLDEYDAAPADFRMPPRDHHVLTVALGYSPRVFQARLGTCLDSDCLPGEATLMPAGCETQFRGFVPAHLRIGISLHRLREAADALRRSGSAGRADLSSDFRIRDAWLGHVGGILSLELGRAAHPAQDLLIDSLAVALSSHLLRNFGVGDFPERDASAGRSVAVRRALDYMESVTDGRISLAELAGAAGISRFHFARTFKREVGVSPVAYLERLRIERAKKLIFAGDISLADVAYAVGFSDQSHFTRRFRRHVGRTPAAYAREHAGRRLPRPRGN